MLKRPQASEVPLIQAGASGWPCAGHYARSSIGSVISGQVTGSVGARATGSGCLSAASLGPGKAAPRRGDAPAGDKIARPRPQGPMLGRALGKGRMVVASCSRAAHRDWRGPGPAPCGHPPSSSGMPVCSARTHTHPHAPCATEPTARTHWHNLKHTDTHWQCATQSLTP